jgi:hypothetical protein
VISATVRKPASEGRGIDGTAEQETETAARAYYLIMQSIESRKSFRRTGDNPLQVNKKAASSCQGLAAG